MYITHEVSIDLAFTQSEVSLPIKVMQGDVNSRCIAFTLKSNGANWTVPEGVSVCVGYRKPDGTGGIYDTLPDGSVAWSVAANVVTVAIAPQALTAVGQVKLAVSLLFGEMVLSTFPAIIQVEPFPGFAGRSEDYVKLFSVLPAVSKADNGKVLQVVDGVWAASYWATYDGEVEVT